jgi:hypothetical protein
MPVIIFDWDLTKTILASYKPEFVTIRPLPVKLIVETKEIIEVLKKDSLLQKEMVDAGGNAVKKYAKDQLKKLKELEKNTLDAYRATGNRKIFADNVEKFQEEYEKLADEATEKGALAVKNVWKEYIKTKNALRNYKIKIGVKVGLCAVSAAAGIGVAATAAAGNLPGIIAGSIGAAKAVSTALQTIHAAAKSADEIKQDLMNDIKNLQISYKDLSNAVVTGQDLFSKAVGKLFTIPITSIEGCETKLNTYKVKITPIEKESHAAARGLNELFEYIEYWEQQIQASKVEKFITDCKSRIAYFEKSVNMKVEHVADLVAKAKEKKKGAEKLEHKIGELKAKLNKKVYEGTSILIDAVVLAAEIWGGAGAEESIEKFCEQAEEQADKVALAAKALAEISEDYIQDIKKS